MDNAIRVLFVCSANICRSPFAERLATALAGDEVDASSAGSWAADGEPMEEPMSAELAERGADGSGFRSRALTADMLDSADLVLTMGVKHRRAILADNPSLVRKVYTLAQFANSVDVAPPGLHGSELLAYTAVNRRSADKADDVADPYGQGRAAAATCAERITALLEVGLSGLLGRPIRSTPKTGSTGVDEPGQDAADDTSRRGFLRRHPGLTALGALIIVALLVVGGWAWFLESKIAGVPKFQFGIDRPHRPKRVPNDAMNILLAGVDDGHGTKLDSALQAPHWRPGVFRSDTIMVVHLNPQRTKAQLISIPRDSYVAIPGHGKNKINAAFSYGGPSLLGLTVENFTGLYLDHVAVVDLVGFKDITDALGGVDLPVDGKNVHYDGVQALKYVRERKSLPRGDFSRIERQQVFMQSVMRRAIASGVRTDPIKLTGLLSAATSHLALDDAFTSGVIRALGWQSRGLRPPNIRFATIPTTGLGTVNGASIVRVNTKAVRALFSKVAHDRFTR